MKSANHTAAMGPTRRSASRDAVSSVRIGSRPNSVLPVAGLRDDEACNECEAQQPAEIAYAPADAGEAAQRGGGTRLGIMLLVNTDENSAAAVATMNASTMSAIVCVGAPGTASQSVASPAMRTTEKTAIQGLRRPRPSA